MYLQFALGATDEAKARMKNSLEPPTKQARMQHPKFCTDPTTGNPRSVTPKLSLWWILYMQDPQPDNPQWAKTFRKQFRLPYNSFLHLLQMVENERAVSGGMFHRWRVDGTCKNRKVSPIELLVLGSLRYLGRGWTFDDLVEESTFIDKEVYRVFFHKFVEFGAKKLYPLYVTTPSTLEELRDCEREYRNAGFPGCIGSTDATHIPLEKMSFGLRQAHLGYKMPCTTRMYNLTVNHRRKILHTTTGHPGRWNDKTLVRYDGFMHQLRDGEFDSTMSFVLSNKSGSDVTIKGAYVIVHNGYLKWPTTVPPLKHSMNRSEIRFSQWLESLRKDVECAFGILKGRWRVLKTGIRMHNSEVADNIWLTCCALHNLLLYVDGLSDGWRNGVPSHWELESGEFDESEVPDAIRRLVDPSGANSRAIRTYDGTTIGYKNDAGHNDKYNSADDVAESCSPSTTFRNGMAVKDLSLTCFRSMLIEHFDTKFHENDMTRLAKKPRQVPTSTIPNGHKFI